MRASYATVECHEPQQRARTSRRHVRTGDGTRLLVTHSGDGSDATVVFMHGLCLDHHSLSAQVGSVRDSFGPGTQVAAYDHRGHGESESAPIGSYTIDRLADDLAHVIGALDGTGPIILVGHSLGGMVALRYATKNPGRVAAMVLCSTSAGQLPEHGLGRLLTLPGIDALVSAVGHLPEIAARAVAAPICSLLHHIHADPAAGGVLVDAIGHAMANASLKTMVGFLPSLRGHDVTRTLWRITADTTVISGELDVLTPVCHGDLIAGSVGGAQHIRLPNLGHMVPQLAQSTVTEAVIAAVHRARRQALTNTR